MHLRVLVNGTLDYVQKWKNDLASIWFNYEYKKGEPKGAFQLGVRTIEIVDLVFPEECLDTVLDIVQPQTSMYKVKDGAIYNKTKRYPWLERFINLMRKAMKLEKVPTKEYKQNIRHMDQVAVHAIGIKKDLRDKDGIEQL